MALVVTKWYASGTPDSNGNYVHLTGREAGLLSWLLSVLKLDATTEVKISDTHLLYTSASLAGTSTRVIPLRSLTSAFYGYHKPWREALILGLLLLPVLFIGVIVGPLYYFLNKTLAIGVVEASGWSAAFAFKRSVIERQSIDEEQAYRVIEIVRYLLEQPLGELPGSRGPDPMPRLTGRTM